MALPAREAASAELSEDQAAALGSVREVPERLPGKAA